MKNKLYMLFSKEDVLRVSERMQNGKMVYFVDLHGMKTKAAKIFLKNILALDMERADVCVIHGYNHGTSIKEMVRTEIAGGNILALTVRNNPGRTVLSFCTGA